MVEEAHIYYSCAWVFKACGLPDVWKASTELAREAWPGSIRASDTESERLIEPVSRECETEQQERQSQSLKKQESRTRGR